MGAGTTLDHWIQDGCELYFVARGQELLEEKNYNLTSSYEKKLEDFQKHCSDRNIVEKCLTSVYKKNVDKHIILFVENIIKKYNKKMDIISVEVEYRNKGLKGDFIIKFDDEIISVSLKNYKKEFKSIQLCSGTWLSFINRFILNNPGGLGPGMYLDSSGKKFRGCTKSKREKYLVENSENSEEIITLMNVLEKINIDIKEKYVKSEEMKIWNEHVSTKWKEDCNILGIKGAEIAKNILDMINDDKKKNIVLKMCGLNIDSEELLCIDSNTSLCSCYDEKYKEIIKKLNSDDVKILIINNGPKLVISFVDQGKNEDSDDYKIISVNIPFTLQKNGAWFLEEEHNNDIGYYHPKEKKIMRYGERRPKKSKELATSTNTHFNLKSCGLYC